VVLLAVGIFIIVVNAKQLASSNPEGVEVRGPSGSTTVGRGGHIALVILGSILVIGGIVLLVLGILSVA
jgi:hypothetical protein